MVAGAYQGQTLQRADQGAGVNDAEQKPFVSLSAKGLRLHVPHGEGFAEVDLSVENATALVAAIAEKLTKLKGKGAVVEIVAWLLKK